MLGVHLDFYPDKPIRLVGTEPGYTEIPTVESGLSEFMKTVQNLPLAEIANKVSKVLDGIDNVVNSPDLKETLVSVHQTVDEAHELLKHVDGQVKPLAKNTELTLDEARKMFASAVTLSQHPQLRVFHRW